MSNNLNDLEMAKKRDHKIMITDEAINMVCPSSSKRTTFACCLSKIDCSKISSVASTASGSFSYSASSLMSCRIIGTSCLCAFLIVAIVLTAILVLL